MYVTSRNNAYGRAIAIKDYGPEFDMLWAVADYETGEIWWVPNSEVRLPKNWSFGRALNENTTSSSPSAAPHSQPETLPGDIACTEFETLKSQAADALKRWKDRIRLERQQAGYDPPEQTT